MPRVRTAAGKLAHAGEVVITQKGKTVDITQARGPLRIGMPPITSYTDVYRGVDFRKHPELYRVGKGEQGVLTAEPYKSELLPLWRFRTPTVARESANALWQAFIEYRNAGDFVGMDMARKFIQMGFTRAKRYARHRTGRKYSSDGIELPLDIDPQKAKAAEVFHSMWDRVERDPIYHALRKKAHTNQR